MDVRDGVANLATKGVRAPLKGDESNLEGQAKQPAAIEELIPGILRLKDRKNRGDTWQTKSTMRLT